VLIAISTYTEPVPVVVNEPQQLQEPEETEHESFAEILAQLLKKPETDSTPEIEAAPISEINFDIADLSIEETVAVNEFNFLGITNEAVNTALEEFSEKKIPDELLSVLANPDLLNSLTVETPDVDSVDFQPEISNLIAEKVIPEQEAAENFFMAEPAEESAVSQISMSHNAIDMKEAMDNKKDSSSKERNSIKTENVKAEETLSVKDSLTAFEKDKIANQQKKSENGNFIKQDDLRSRSRKTATIEVKDMRTETVNNTQMNTFKVVETATGRVQEGSATREITLEFKLPEINSQSTAQTTWEAKAGTSLENMLAREMHQNLNGDIVRHASIALRNGGEGTIKIALKPESLGNVKIHLEMSENKITGRIVVESTEALNAFRKEMSALEQAFRDSGFASADLNLSLTADGQNANEWEQETDSFSPRMAALRYEGEQDALSAVDVYIEQKHGLINMLA
jgi:flagellar hook-length control protein FliK